MSFDINQRFRQALEPAPLTSFRDAFRAFNQAVDDCRNGGHKVESDPSVNLLLRHLASISEAQTDSRSLRQACINRISDQEKTPLLLLLAERGVSYQAEAKKRFLSEGMKAMRRLAAALELPKGDYDIRACEGGPAVSGEIILHSNELYVQLGLTCLGKDHEIMFRKVKGRDDYCGERNHFSSIRAFITPDRFAQHLRATLGLHSPSFANGRLFA